MADLQLNAKNGRKNVTTPRIDLTPMVDLGFLLLTFFIMTTSMSKHKAIDIQMPFTPSTATTAYYESSAITFIPAEEHRIFYYEGIFNPALPLKEVSGLNQEALRNILLEKQKAISSRSKKEEREVQISIKAHAKATVDDIIQLFDEVNLLKINYVAMVDINKEETEKVDIQLNTRTLPK